jgi:hypothetical protein
LNQIKLLLITLFTFCLVFCFSGFSQESEVAVKPSFRDEIKLKDNYTEQELLELINQQEKGLYKYEPNFISCWIQVINATSWLNNNLSITNIGFS